MFGNIQEAYRIRDKVEGGENGQKVHQRHLLFLIYFVVMEHFGQAILSTYTGVDMFTICNLNIT